MVKKYLLIMYLSCLSVYAHDGAYIEINSGSIKIGNKSIERTIELLPNNVTTGQIINKLSGSVYDVKSGEFALNIVFSGWGPAYSKNQNGESPVVLTANDCQFSGYNSKDLNDSGKELELKYNFHNDMANYTINVYYQVFPDNFYMRKWIEISDSAAGIQFLDKIFIESLTFKEADFSHGQYGQPVFNNDIFLGVEYPTAENSLSNNCAEVGYLVGQKIEKSVYKSHTSILGAAPSSVKLEQTFMNYVDQIKVKGTRQFLLYNTWYDLRFQWLVDNPDNIMNENNVLNRIDSFKNYLTKYDIKLNAFVIDMGWDKITAEWQIDSARFPNGFTKIVNALDGIHSSLGIWASPFGGYEERDKRAKWAAEHGYETSGDYLCFAGEKYKTAMQNAMANYTKNYNLAYFKWDGLSIACNEVNHGHLPGIYSHETVIKNFVGMIDSVRKINPDIFLNITIGSWLSPWWLKYADCVWMQGADYGYADDVPCINDRDKAITFKDGVLWDDFRKQNLLFPISSIMTHGIIKGSLNLLGGKNETLDSFSNEVMMYFGRGVMMWELYLTPDLISENELNSIATTIKWAKANKEVLNNTKMILGNPLKEEPYGFIHFTKDKGILLLRNPGVESREIKFKISPELGDIDSSKKYFVKIIYPYNFILPEPVSVNHELKIDIGGYEILTAELIPSQKINKNLPAGIKYSIDKNNLTVYSEAGTSRKIESVDGKNITDVNFKGTSADIGIERKYSAGYGNNEFISTCKLNIPVSYKGASVAFLLERTKTLKGVQTPNAEIKINGVTKKINFKQENGKWFWISADLDQKVNDISCKITLENKENWKISGWLFADEELSGKNFDSSGLIEGSELLPAKPYSANICKRIISLNKNN